MHEIDDCDLDHRIDRVALNASEFISTHCLSPVDGLDRTQTFLAKRIIADVAWLVARLPEDSVGGIHDRVIDRMRTHLGIGERPDYVPAFGELGIALAIKAGPATLEKSDCGKELSGASGFGGSATFPSGATVTACVFTKDQKPVGGSVTGGWKCSF